MADDINSSLPERMELNALIKMFCPGERKKNRRILYQIAERDIKTGKLTAEGDIPFWVSPDEFRIWLKKNRIKLEVASLREAMKKSSEVFSQSSKMRQANSLSNELEPVPHQLFQSRPEKLKRGDRQIAWIEKAVNILGLSDYPEKDLPYGARKSIMDFCEKSYLKDFHKNGQLDTFSEDAFKNAWKKSRFRCKN